MEATNTAYLPLESIHELQAAVDDTAPRSDEAIRAACLRMDQMREATRQRLGELSTVADLIREIRE